jgi:hypothetical protein
VEKTVRILGVWVSPQASTPRWIIAIVCASWRAKQQLRGGSHKKQPGLDAPQPNPIEGLQSTAPIKPKTMSPIDPRMPSERLGAWWLDALDRPACFGRVLLGAKQQEGASGKLLLAR